jgi:pimeloyl-ACP methyl ester carboxylesterase
VSPAILSNQRNPRMRVLQLFLHAAYDYICETIDSRLAEPMRAHCENLTEFTVMSGHWMAQEKPSEVNAALTKWLAAQLPTLWPPNEHSRDKAIHALS